MTTQRYHFLDGLRGVAMLLGIVLHASMTFRGWDVWGVEEVSVAPEFFGWVFDFIHGFRMQLFFVVSGFFTMMLAKRRGLVSLLKQRLLRIVVPLVVGTLILSPMIYVLSAWGEERGRVHAAPEGADENLLEAVAIGDADRVAEWIEQGADLEARGDNEETPLISAAFFGRVDCVELLLGAGADVEAKDRWGTNSMKAATMDFKIVKGIADSFGL
ncbi:acyltransferase family protein, partial [Akkermansiaceae bacterium]|nr:acyltransferase family protein [Akkermansiaceae bacterium]